MTPGRTNTEVTTTIQMERPLAKPLAWNKKHLGLRLSADLVAGFSAAIAVAPLITVIDKAIMQNASGQAPLLVSIRTSLLNLALRPHAILFSKPVALITMLYGGTYLTANTLDTFTSTTQARSASHTTSGTAKFAASSAANVGLCLFKDQAFARLFGPGGPPRPVPLPSYLLFTTRDCFTIFASFNVPPLLGPVVNARMSKQFEMMVSGQTIAQFAAPAAVQLVSTPMHLLGLDMYNRTGVTWGDRWAAVKRNWGVSALARMCRIVPAFGFGGVINSGLRKDLMRRLE